MEPDKGEERVVVVTEEEFLSLQASGQLQFSHQLGGTEGTNDGSDGGGFHLATDGTVQFLQDIAMETSSSASNCAEDYLSTLVSENPISVLGIADEQKQEWTMPGQQESCPLLMKVNEAEAQNTGPQQLDASEAAAEEASPAPAPASPVNYIQPVNQMDRRLNKKKRNSEKKRSQSKKRKKVEDTVVISIHRQNVLARVVVAKDAPYVCGYCARAFTHSSSLKDHVELDHAYVEPAKIIRNGIGDQIVMKRTFLNKPKNSLGNKIPRIKGGINIKSLIRKPVSRRSVPLSANNCSEKTSVADDSDDAIEDEDELDAGDGENDLSSSSDASEPEEGKAFKVDNAESVAVVASQGIMLQKTNQSGVSAASKILEPTQDINRPAELHPSNGNKSSVRGAGTTDPESSLQPRQSQQIKQSGNMAKHRKKHPFKCIYCCGLFDTHSKRSEHYAQVHGEYRDQAQARAYGKTGTDGTITAGDDDGSPQAAFVCSTCNVYFHEESAAQKHMSFRHCGEGQVKCETCTEASRLWEEGKNEELVKLLEKRKGEKRESGQKEASKDTSSVNLEASCSKDPGINTDVLVGKEKAKDILRRSLKHTNATGSTNVFILKCPKCGEEFFQIQHLQNHYKWHGALTCEDCSEICETMSEYVSHHAKIHRTLFFKCRFCELKYEDQGKLNYHMLGHLGFFQCIVCGATSMSKSTLKKHIAAEIDNPSHAEVIGTEHKRFSAREPYLQHLSTHKKGRRRVSRTTSQCQYCGQVFNMNAHYVRHMHSAHPTEYFESRSTENLFCCEQCGKFLSSKSSLQVHIKMHARKSIPCPVDGCEMVFYKSVYLNMHLLAHEDPSVIPERVPGTVKCSLCSKMFKNEASLTKHLCLHIGTVPKFNCRFCNKAFRAVTHLRYHEKHHTGEKDQVCKFCGKAYADPSVLKTHLLTHSTHKPFKCQYCDRAFPTVIYLRAHIRSHTKPFKCSQCNEGFSTKVARRNHLKKMHDIVEPAGKQSLLDKSVVFDVDL